MKRIGGRPPAEVAARRYDVSARQFVAGHRPHAGRNALSTDETSRPRTDSTSRRRGGLERRVELERNRAQIAYENQIGNRNLLQNNTIKLQTICVSMTIMAARSSEPGRRAHRAAFGKLELDPAECGEVRVDCPAEVLRGRRFADPAQLSRSEALKESGAGRSIHKRWPAECAPPRRAQPGPRSGRTRPRADACA